MSNCKKNILTQRLREMRAKHGLNQEYVADTIGLKRTNIANYESGRNVPPVDKLCLLADLYHTTIDYLAGRTNQIEPFLQNNDIISIQNIKHLRLDHQGIELSTKEKEAIVKTLESMLSFKEQQ